MWVRLPPRAPKSVGASCHFGPMYDLSLHRRARDLYADGNTQTQVGDQLGVSQRSISRWLSGKNRVRPDGESRVVNCPRCFSDQSLDECAYAALLGFYLGDGHIARHPRRSALYSLSVVQDLSYPDSADEINELMRRVIRTSPFRRIRNGCAEVKCWSSHMTCLFPQHGPGRKHTRRILLAPWQIKIVERQPEDFLRGLLHSDGCRVINRVRRVTAAGARSHEYPRYFFTNYSEDILGLCAWALDLLEIPWRRNRWNCLSVARREGVRRLDEFVGPKS